MFSVFAQKKGDKFLLFLKAFSWETDLWVTVGDFTAKNGKSGKRNLYVTENQLRRDKIWCEADNNNNSMCHICAKELYDLNFNQAVIYKISNFNKIAPNLTYKYNWNLLDQLFLSYKFHGRDMSGIYFFFFYFRQLWAVKPEAWHELLSSLKRIFPLQERIFPKGPLRGITFQDTNVDR